MKINERLRDTREDLDLTQGEVCKALDISRKQLGRWENGTSEMGIEKLKRICIFYGVSADYILGLPKNMKWHRKIYR